MSQRLAVKNLPLLAIEHGNGQAELGADEVISGQALPKMAVDAQGNIVLAWYDTRRDPANHLLDGCVSTSRRANNIRAFLH